jgi:hypothetical protein
MSKIVKLNEQDLVRLVKRVIKEQLQSESKFKAEGVVEDDMMMSFPVTEISYVDDTVNMTMIDPVSKEKLYVTNFRGPIYSGKNNTKKYRDVSFNNINMKNYNQIAKQFNIPFLTT